MKTVPAVGGASQALAEAGSYGGGSWGPDDNIYFPPSPESGLWKIPASGGDAEPVTTLNRGTGEVSHRYPQVLPGGDAVLFTVWTGPGFSERHVHLQVLGTGERRELVRGGSTGRYVASGHLVYSQFGATALVAVPFDLENLEVTGPPVVLPAPVREVKEGAQYAVSDSGLLAYVPGEPQYFERGLVWVGRDGIVEPLSMETRAYVNPAISPDGRLAAVQTQGASTGIWLYDFSRSTLSPLRTPGSSQAPVWTADGQRLVYRGTRAGFRNLFWKTIDDSGGEKGLTTGEHLQTPWSSSPNGQWVAFEEVDPQTGSDIWYVALDGDRNPQRILGTQSTERMPAFSPNGRWLAYVSDGQVYVRSFPEGGGRTVISTARGFAPAWSRDGRELFYRDGVRMMAVDIDTTEEALVVGTPHVLFEGRYNPGIAGRGYDVAPDGRFLMVRPIKPEPPHTQINVVLNWFDELQRLVPSP